jgi:translation initiation factor 1
LEKQNKKLQNIETTEVVVRTKTVRFGRNITQIEMDVKDEKDLKAVARMLKIRLACGGTVKDGVIMLQGNHSREIPRLFEDQNLHPEIRFVPTQ